MSPSRNSADLFGRREVTVAGVRTRYRLFEPGSTGGDARLPVVLFLHGAGESGTDDRAPTTVGIGPAIRRDPARFPALVVLPQASQGYGWRGFNLAAAEAALEDVLGAYPVDPGRIVVTGVSMGGYGTWLAALRRPDLYAAAAPICGGLDSRSAGEAGLVDPSRPEPLALQAARRLSSLPQWVFHGDADTIIPVEESRRMVEALRSVGAPVRYTEYAGVAHNSWDRAYATRELVPWLLAAPGDRS